MQDDQSFTAFFVGMVIGMICSLLFYGFVIEPCWKQSAVNHNAAKWIMNPANGEVKWQWNDENPEKKP